jgi:4-amino-4-deoxy-L-arabinose transferase-like glycosyltransferase
LVLAILEVCWLGWFLIEPLPSFPREKGTLRRWQLVAKAFPEVVPGTSFRQSLLGQALLELSHVENLRERVPIVAAAGLVAAAALALGELVLAALRLRARLRPAERLAVNFGLGTAILGLLTLLAGRAALLYPWLFRTGLVLIAVGGFSVSRIWQAKWPRPGRDAIAAGLLIAPFLIIMFLGAMLPSIDFDVLEYHLQGPKEYFQAGRIAFLPHNVYTNMPFVLEIFHIIGIVVLGDCCWGGLVGQLLVALYAPAAAALIASVAGRAGSLRAAWLAAVVYLTTPWVYRLGVIAYVEGPLCFYHAALVWAVSWGWNDRQVSRGSIWALIGLLAGGGMACKYPALISAVIPFGLLSLLDSSRSRSVRPLLAYALGWSIVIGPWLARNVIDTGNPVYPLGYHVFGGKDWDSSREARWFQVHGPFKPTLSDFGNSLVDVAGRSDWQSPLYVALAPLAFCRRDSRRVAIAVGGYAAYLFLTWWFLTHRLDRFWLPLLPHLAILAGLGADWTDRMSWRWLRGAILGFAVLCNFVDCTTALTGLNEWTGSLRLLRIDVPRRLNPHLAAIDRELPSTAKILLVGSAAVFHVNHPILYNTVFTPETIEVLAAGKSPATFHRALRERGVTHVYVDWKEIRRYREPGNYGFTDFVTPDRFAEWVKSGVLDRSLAVGSEQELYAVK